MDVSAALTDPDLGFTAFTVQRIMYRLQNGESVPSVQTLPASGCIHPGTPEMVQLLPEEERHEEFPCASARTAGEPPIPPRTGSSGTGKPGG